MSNSANRMINEGLPKVLKNVFGEDYVHNNYRVLTHLLTLVAYYAEDDLSKEMIQECNRLRAILVQIEELKSIMERISHISNYRCDFSSDPRSQIAPNYTFSPQFPNITDICTTLADKTETVKKELSEIDTVSICIYVRKKAVAAGDL